MTWSSLTADADYMRGANRDVFNLEIATSLTKDSDTVTITDTNTTALLTVGMMVTGKGVPSGTSISSISSSTVFKLSQKATATINSLLSIERVSDSELEELYVYEAKLDVKHDIINALGIDQEDDTTLDTVVDLNTEKLQMVLAIKQLEYYYLQNNEGEGSQTYERYKYYRKKYEEHKVKFSSLMVRKLGVAYTTITVQQFG